MLCPESRVRHCCLLFMCCYVLFRAGVRMESPSEVMHQFQLLTHSWQPLKLERQTAIINAAKTCCNARARHTNSPTHSLTDACLTHTCCTCTPTVQHTHTGTRAHTLIISSEVSPFPSLWQGGSGGGGGRVGRGGGGGGELEEDEEGRRSGGGRR